MANNNMVKMLAMLIVCILVVTPTEAALGCGAVISYVSPCISYLRGVVPLSSGCCNGVRSLNTNARTTPDRQSACNCLKTQAGRIPGIRGNLVKGLPSACGVNIPYQLTPSTDCSKVR